MKKKQDKCKGDFEKCDCENCQWAKKMNDKSQKIIDILFANDLCMRESFHILHSLMDTMFEHTVEGYENNLEREEIDSKKVKELPKKGKDSEPVGHFYYCPTPQCKAKITLEARWDLIENYKLMCPMCHAQMERK